MELFERGYRKRRWSTRIAGLLMLVLCPVAIVWGLSDHTDYQMARMASVGFLGVPVSIAVLAASFWPARGLAALRTPEAIVWYYGKGKGQYIHTIMLGLQSGRLVSLPLAHHRDAGEAMTTLGVMAPTATCGYSEERRQAFRRDPQSLRVLTRAHAAGG